MTDRIATLDWPAIAASLWVRGWATTGPLLSPAECEALRESYDDEAQFRARVIMARHRFGEGEYKYFGRPMPPLVTALREASYARLAPIARDWNQALDADSDFPDAHAGFIDRCRAHGQTRPTPLLLRYATGGYNCLHQDLYGKVHFPLQMVVMLNRPGNDYSGGHFLLVENRPRAQSAGEALLPGQGEAVIFTTRLRPVRSARGFSRATVRHGVSTVTYGERFTLGIVYHDAE